MNWQFNSISGILSSAFLRFCGKFICPIHPLCNGLYNQIQHENHFYLPVNTDKPKFVAFLVFFCTTAQSHKFRLSKMSRNAGWSKLMRTWYIYPWLVHFSVSICQCFTFKRCDKFKLKCTSHGSMYCAHYFGKISMTWKQWMM